MISFVEKQVDSLSLRRHFSVYIANSLLIWWQSTNLWPRCVSEYIQRFFGDSGKTEPTEPQTA